MALATATPSGRPSVRMVLLRGLDERGLGFFTNYESRKADELAANPQAAVVLNWGPPLRRQVRAEGRVERLSEVESRAYFESRSRESRLGAWASPQSRPLADRDELDRRYAETMERFPDEDVPLPSVLGRIQARAAGGRALAEPAEPASRPRPLRANGGRLVEGAAGAVTLRKVARARSSCRARRRSRAGSPWRPAAGLRAPAASPARGRSSSPGSTGSAGRGCPSAGA